MGSDCVFSVLRLVSTVVCVFGFCLMGFLSFIFALSNEGLKGDTRTVTGGDNVLEFLPVSLRKRRVI